jgi:glycosyltransferase involved in cell wall biosynthesis
MTTLDILIPFWGDVGYLKQAVQSVRRQDDPDWRLVVVDDAYPDESLAAWFVGLDDTRVTYMRNAENLGANANYRHALALAQGEYVVVMGADDVMLPHYVSHVRSVIDAHPEVSVIQPQVAVVDEHDRQICPIPDRVKRVLRPSSHHEVTMLSGDGLAASLLGANWTYFPSLCWKREGMARIGFREGLDVVQDLALLLDICADGGQLAVTETTAFWYRRHNKSDSSVRAMDGRRFDEERRFFRMMATEFQGRGWTRTARSARVHATSRLHALLLIPRALKDGNVQMVRALGRHVVRT